MNKPSRKKTWVIISLLAILGLSLGTVDCAWARGGGWGCRTANLTPEQAGQVFDLRQKHFNNTAGLRRQMAEKRAELRTLWKSQSPNQDQIAAKQKELWTLREQLQAKAATYRAEAGKIAPAGYGPGLGRGPGGGMGRGRCW
jgi:zinc resistance-associated protein